MFVNDGTGGFTVMPDVLGNTNGTLGLAAADLNGDDRLDIVEAQGEWATPEKVYLGEAVPPDAAAPIVGNVTAVDGTLHARVHDHKSPSGAHDSQAVAAEGDGATLPMAWYGEHLWRVDVPQPGEYRVCATDAAGNQTCSDPVTVAAEG